ncbi:hypothetical protein GQ457_13G017670 [Hibiscus cannabinus]
MVGNYKLSSRNCHRVKCGFQWNKCVQAAAPHGHPKFQITIFSNAGFSTDGKAFAKGFHFLVEDVGGIWSVFVEQSSEPSTDTNTIPTHNLRVTYTISQSKVLITRNNGKKKKKPIRLSKIIANEDVDGVICHFIFHAECRERLRLPQGYFGNCLQPCVTASKRNEQKMGL